MIILIKKIKLIDVKVILNIKAKVNIIMLDVAICFEILIIYSLGMILRIIIDNKFRFIRFINNILIIIKNLII